jgi:hypothetical protein
VTGRPESTLAAEVAEALIGAGWRPGRRNDVQARAWGLRLASHASPGGRQHTVFPAALDAFARYGGLTVEPDGAADPQGPEEVARSGFTLDPLRALHTVETLTALAARIGAALAPLGEEAGGVGILAIDEQGRVFVLDHAGEWFLGASIDEALGTLVLGRRPARVREDGTWT